MAAGLTFERFVDDNFMVVVPLPFDGWLRAAFRLAAQGDIVALAYNHITGGQRVVNVWRHCGTEENEKENGKRRRNGYYYYSCQLNINSKQAALDLNAKTFAFFGKRLCHESGNSYKIQVLTPTQRISYTLTDKLTFYFFF